MLPIEVQHGNITALGLRITGEDDRAIVYLPDVNDIPDAAWPAIISTR